MEFQAKIQAKIFLLNCAPGAAVARVLDEVVREEDLAAGLVPVEVVHAHVRVRAVGAAGERETIALHGISDNIHYYTVLKILFLLRVWHFFHNIQANRVIKTVLKSIIPRFVSSS